VELSAGIPSAAKYAGQPNNVDVDNVGVELVLVSLVSSSRHHCGGSIKANKDECPRDDSHKVQQGSVGCQSMTRNGYFVEQLFFRMLVGIVDTVLGIATLYFTEDRIPNQEGGGANSFLGQGSFSLTVTRCVMIQYAPTKGRS